MLTVWPVVLQEKLSVADVIIVVGLPQEEVEAGKIAAVKGAGVLVDVVVVVVIGSVEITSQGKVAAYIL